MNRMRIGGTVAVVATLAIGLALFLGLWSHWTASAQDTFIVNKDTGTGDPAPCNAPDFPSVSDIETVIDDADVADGDTIVLCPGTYNAGAGGTVEVDKGLTIEGLATADRDEIVVQGSDADGFVISVDGATLRHLKLVGDGSDNAISIEEGADNSTIQDMEITDWEDGVILFHAAGNVVESSKIHDIDEEAVDLTGGGNNTIRNNEITDSEGGVDIGSEDGDLVEGNTLSGNRNEQIFIAGKVTARIERNNIAVSSDGIHIRNTPAESLIVIGGSADKANTFTGPFGDPDYYVELTCAAENTVEATYNWWGSTNRIDIANRIFNDEDDDGTECPAPDDVKGAVVFHPWASGPAPTPTPSPTPSPTATPTPTATATTTATATATPAGATRTIDLSPPGWHDLAWSGADAADPGTALACIAGKYSIAYAWEGPSAGFKRYVEGCAVPGICNMAALNKYDALLVNVSADAVTCTMPVVQ